MAYKPSDYRPSPEMYAQCAAQAAKDSFKEKTMPVVHVGPEVQIKSIAPVRSREK